MSIEAFVKAAAEGDIAAMDDMLKADPEIAAKTLPGGMSPLTAALYYGKQQAVEWLLEQGIAVTVHEAAMLGDEETLAYLLDIEPKLLSLFSFDGWTPLHLASFFGGYDAAKLLIERGADVNVRSANPMAETPLHIAAAGSRTEIVSLLLQRGADPNAKGSGGWTALHRAADRCDADTARLLVRFGADAFLPAEDGKSPRDIAAERGYEEVLEALR